MDYKKVFRSRKIRSKILRFLSFVPDKPMLKLQYRIKMKRNLNLRNPKRYTEKLQWYKMYYRNPIMHQCVDKYNVRSYVTEKGLDDILIPLYQKCKSIDDLVWDELPEQFVLKTTNGGGGLNVVICQSKSELNIEDIKSKLGSKKVKQNIGGREWAYYGLEPGIVAEKLLIDETNPTAGINDYKIFCYKGKPLYIVVDVDRYIGHKRNFYDVSWNNLHINSDCSACDRELPKPENFDRMLEIAAQLSGDFPYVRVDLYNINGKIYFGELTFYPWSGYVQFEPDEFDYLLGEPFKLEKYDSES